VLSITYSFAQPEPLKNINELIKTQVRYNVHINLVFCDLMINAAYVLCRRRGVLIISAGRN
jgi:hypothetical protein